jgi:hypothetical protein
VHGVAQRATACGQHLALVHRGKRPQEAKGSIGHQQAAHDLQPATSTG